MSLERQELIRYSRQIMLDGIQVDGQAKLKGARAVIVGVGGLGCPAATYLASAGLGHLSLVDDDVVETSNLQRQTLFRQQDLGTAKVTAAKQHISELNPHIEVTAIQSRLDEEDFSSLFKTADVVLDCSDNFATRHAINRACHAGATALVSGAAIRYEGQLSVFDFRPNSSIEQSARGCYHCIFPETSDQAENCSSAGIFAPIVGIIGAMQAQEALKIILNIPQSQSMRTTKNRLHCYDGLQNTWRQIQFTADPHCPVCS